MAYQPTFEQDVIQRLTRIEDLARVTNGRVSKLEGTVDAHDETINKAKGVFWTLQILWVLITAWLGLKGKQ